MKLLDVTEFYSPRGGGVRTYLLEKARWLASRADVEHTIAVPADRTETTVWERSRVHLLRGPGVPASPGYHFLIAGRQLARIVERERPDVIEVGSPYVAPWLVRRATRGTAARLVAFVHENPRLYAGALAAPVGVYLRAAHRDFDLAVAASPDNLGGLGVARTAVVPLGVDTTTFHPARRDPAWRAAIGAAPGQPVALYVGRLSAEKGLDVVLEAAPEIHRTTGTRIVLIGEGHLRRRLEAAARAQPDVLRVLPFEPDRARLARAYSSADLFLAPCRFETFGLAALEAMASGLPVVGVAAAGIGRLLDGADWGRTYRAGDAGDCARAVCDLVALDLAAAGRRARACAVARYGWERTFSELLELYRGLLARDAASASSRAPSAAGTMSV